MLDRATASVRFLSGEREPVRVATTANIVLDGLQTIDGVALAVNDRVLVKDQTDARTNGIYTASEGLWHRASDARFPRAIAEGVTVQVQEGTTHGEEAWRFTSTPNRIGDDPITLQLYLAADLPDTARLLSENIDDLLLVASSIGEGGYFFVKATDVGDGTPNAIQATSSIPIPSADAGALVAFNIFESNTGAATISFNGGSALTILGVGGEAVESGDLVAGMIVAGYKSGTAFRLITDTSSATNKAAAEAAQAAAEAARDAAEGAAETVVVARYNSKAGVEAATVSVVIQSIETTGYAAAGDGGGATYKRVGSEPAHAGKIQSTDGAWWELAETVVNPVMFGASGNGTTNDRDAFQACLAYPNARILDGLGRNYRVESNLTPRGNLTIQNVTFDFSFGPENGSMLSCEGSQDTAINLSSSATAGTKELSLTSAGGIVAGDYLMLSSTQLWDSTNNVAFSEMVRVNSVSGSTVTLMSPILYTYGVGNGAKVEKLNFLPGLEFKNVSAVGGGTVQNQRAIDIRLCIGVLIDNCSFDNFENRSIQFDRCAHSVVRRTSASRSDRAGLGYGVAVINGCHWINVETSVFSRMRHAVAVGGATYVNRYITCSTNHCYGMFSAGMDSHPGGDYVSFIDNFIACDPSGGDDGIIHQGLNGTISRNSITGAGRHGIFVQQLMTAAQVGTCRITDNDVRGSSSGSGIFVSTDGASSIQGLDISGNTVSGFAIVVRARALAGAVGRFAIANNKNTGIASNKGIFVETAGTQVVQFGTISGNTLRVADGGTECIYLNAAASGNVRYVTISANTTFDGSHGARGVNTNSIATTGNVFVSAATAAVDVAGAGSVSANNVTA